MRPNRTSLTRHGFTLIELLVAVGALSLIVLVLFRIFDQTQKALRSNVAQVDVMEGGRSLLELLARELEQVDAEGSATNLYLGLSAVPTALDLPGSEPNTVRANEFYELMFLTPVRQEGTNGLWEASLYRLLSVDNLTPDNVLNPMWVTNLATEGVGWVGRRSMRIDLAGADPRRVLETNTWRAFRSLLLTNAATLSDYARVADGIVHFRFVPLDSRGQPLGQYPTNAYPGVVQVPSGWVPRVLDVRDYYFTGSTLPAFLQLEVGIMEPQVVARWRGLPTRQSRADFLNQQSTRIHYFQQRIPLQNARRLLPNVP